MPLDRNPTPSHPALAASKTGLATILAWALFLSPVHALEKTSWKFTFGSQGKTGYTAIGPTNVYATANGYGFDFGFDAMVKYTPSKDGVEGKVAGKNAYNWTGLPFYAPKHSAFLFSANVPVGNYEVKITMGSKDSAVKATVRAEQRRLMIEDWTIPVGQTETRVIHVNRRKKGTSLTTREQDYIDLDDRLSIEFNGDHPVLTELEITKVDTDITVYLAGNSTVVDQPQEPWSTWGANFPRFFKGGVAISDQAESGLSAQSFVGARLDNILSTIKAGDYVFVEFGHNDAKDATATANFSANLTTFATKVKAKGGTTVLVTPTARNLWTGTTPDNSLLADFVAKMKTVAAAQAIDYLDLNAAAVSFLQSLTPTNSKKAYCYFPANTVPGQTTALADGTHWNDYGGYELAKWMATAVKAKKLGFAKYLADDHVDFDPSKPDAYATFGLPFSPFLDTTFTPPDSAVGPSVHVLPGDIESKTLLRSASIRDGEVDLELEGEVVGTEIRLFAADGSLEASRLLGSGASAMQRIGLGQGAAHGIHVLKIERDGHLLDSKVLQP